MNEATNRPQTIQEAATALVEKTADRLLWRRFGDPAYRGVTREAIKAELWASPQGRLLRDLYHHIGAEPMAKARGKVLKLKGAERELLQKGLKLLDDGFPTGE